MAAKRDRLASYRGKRSFERTPEPGGEAGAKAGEDRFVIQEHHARRLHWDFRLERDGVLVSWALPRGVPADPEQDRLAVHTEDHPLDYIDFAGEIPKGEYGGGKVTIWDRGTYEVEKWEQGKVVIRLAGERVRGRYALFRTRGKDWMIHRMDAPEPGDPFPQRIEPMRATPGRLPRDDADWAFEVRWSGVRAIAYCETGHVRVEGADGDELTPRFRELGAIALELAGEQVVLDGEIVVFEDGVPSAERLERRLAPGSDSTIRRRQREHPATLVVFDLLYADRTDPARPRLRGPARAAGGARARRAQLADPGLPPRRRQGAARRGGRARARRRGRQAPREPLPAGQAQPRLARRQRVARPPSPPPPP